MTDDVTDKITKAFAGAAVVVGSGFFSWALCLAFGGLGELHFDGRHGRCSLWSWTCSKWKDGIRLVDRVVVYGNVVHLGLATSLLLCENRTFDTHVYARKRTRTWGPGPRRDRRPRCRKAGECAACQSGAGKRDRSFSFVKIGNRATSPVAPRSLILHHMLAEAAIKAFKLLGLCARYSQLPVI